MYKSSTPKQIGRYEQIKIDKFKELAIIMCNEGERTRS